MAEGEGITGAATKMVEDTTHKVVEQGKSWFSSLLSSPWDLIKGLFLGSIKGIGGAGKGLISNTIGNPLGLVTTGGIVVGLVKFVPHFVYWISESVKVKIGGKTITEIFAADEHNMGKLMMDAGIAAALINGTIGVGSGLVSSAADSSEGSEKSFMEKTGGILGSAAIIGGLGFLAYSKVSGTHIGAVEPADHSDKTPTPLNTQAVTPPIPTKSSPAVKQV